MGMHEVGIELAKDILFKRRTIGNEKILETPNWTKWAEDILSTVRCPCVPVCSPSELL